MSAVPPHALLMPYVLAGRMSMLMAEMIASHMVGTEVSEQYIMEVDDTICRHQRWFEEHWPSCMVINRKSSDGIRWRRYSDTCHLDTDGDGDCRHCAKWRQQGPQNRILKRMAERSMA